MKIKISSKSIAGKTKTINQDAFVVEQNKYNQILFALADGVGSYKSSNFASEISCNILKKEFLKINFSEFSKIEIKEWGNRIIKEVIKNKLISLNSKMATTLTFVILVEKYLFVFHIGNTRFYQFKKNNEEGKSELFQITTDHDIRIDKDQIFHFAKEKQFLSNSLSNIANCYVDFYKLNAYSGQYMLTTDGIHSFLKNKEFKHLLDNDFSLNEKVELIYENAIFNGSLDDITIILFKIN